jgi:hypothetical protein
MANSFDPYREALVVENHTIWPADCEGAGFTTAAVIECDFLPHELVGDFKRFVGFHRAVAWVVVDVARAGNAPDDAEADHQRDGEADDGVVWEECAVFAKGERDEGGGDETGREEPVKEAGGQIPDEDSVHDDLLWQRQGGAADGLSLRTRSSGRVPEHAGRALTLEFLIWRRR